MAEQLGCSHPNYKCICMPLTLKCTSRLYYRHLCTHVERQTDLGEESCPGQQPWRLDTVCRALVRSMMVSVHRTEFMPPFKNRGSCMD